MVRISTKVTICAEAAGLFKVLDTNGAPLLGSYTSGAAGTKALGGCADIDSGALARAQTANKTLYLIASPNTSIEEGDLRINLGAATAAKFTIGDYIQIYDKDTVQVPGADTVPPTINKHEIRLVIAIGTSDGNDAALCVCGRTTTVRPHCWHHGASKGYNTHGIRRIASHGNVGLQQF